MSGSFEVFKLYIFKFLVFMKIFFIGVFFLFMFLSLIWESGAGCKVKYFFFKIFLAKDERNKVEFIMSKLSEVG